MEECTVGEVLVKYGHINKTDAKRRYLMSFSRISLSLLSYVFAVAFQPLITKRKNAAPIAGVIFVCVLCFITCPGPTVSKVMSLQTEVGLGRSR